MDNKDNDTKESKVMHPKQIAKILAIGNSILIIPGIAFGILGIVLTYKRPIFTLGIIVLISLGIILLIGYFKTWLSKSNWQSKRLWRVSGNFNIIALIVFILISPFSLLSLSALLGFLFETLNQGASDDNQLMIASVIALVLLVFWQVSTIVLSRRYLNYLKVEEATLEDSPTVITNVGDSDTLTSSAKNSVASDNE